MRTPNNPLTESVLLPALAALVHGSPPNTQMSLGSPSGTGAEVTYTNSAYLLSQGLFPALHLTTGTRSAMRNSLHSYTGNMVVHFTYFDRFDEQTMTIDVLREQMRIDLLRMQGSLETYLQDNEGITVGNTVYPLSFTKATLAGYDTALDSTFPGLVLATRTLDCTFTLLPYAV